MLRVKEKAYSYYPSLLGYDNISIGVVPHILASSKVKTLKTLNLLTFEDRGTRFLQTSGIL
jgi:hypothetical protein